MRLLNLISYIFLIHINVMNLAGQNLKGPYLTFSDRELLIFNVGYSYLNISSVSNSVINTGILLPNQYSIEENSREYIQVDLIKGFGRKEITDQINTVPFTAYFGMSILFPVYTSIDLNRPESYNFGFISDSSPNDSYWLAMNFAYVKPSFSIGIPISIRKKDDDFALFTIEPNLGIEIPICLNNGSIRYKSFDYNNQSFYGELYSDKIRANSVNVNMNFGTSISCALGKSHKIQLNYSNSSSLSDVLKVDDEVFGFNEVRNGLNQHLFSIGFAKLIQ